MSHVITAGDDGNKEKVLLWAGAFPPPPSPCLKAHQIFESIFYHLHFISYQFLVLNEYVGCLRTGRNHCHPRTYPIKPKISINIDKNNQCYQHRVSFKSFSYHFSRHRTLLTAFINTQLSSESHGKDVFGKYLITVVIIIIESNLANIQKIHEQNELFI